MKACCTGTASRSSTGTAALPRSKLPHSVAPPPIRARSAVLGRLKCVSRHSRASLARFALFAQASAPAEEIRLARQFSMGYLQLNVMEHQQLIEKHSKALGLDDVKVSWFTFNGPTAVNEALISGNIDVGSGGVPGLLMLWARSKGTP